MSESYGKPQPSDPKPFRATVDPWTLQVLVLKPSKPSLQRRGAGADLPVAFAGTHWVLFQISAEPDKLPVVLFRTPQKESLSLMYYVL